MKRFTATVLIVVALALAAPFGLIVLYGFVAPHHIPIVHAGLREKLAEQNWAPLNDVNADVVRAVIMAEDARFCLHYGVDLRQLRIVLEDAMAGKEPRGASTITMQVVKNLLLWPERSYFRKALEAPLAVWMDLVLPKRRILEIYLNVAQWGPYHYGVEAGAQRAFRMPSAALSKQQALALATVLPAPSSRNAAAPSARQRAVMAHVERELSRAPWVFSCLPRSLRP